MASEGVKQWITVNGKHIPIMEGQSKEDAVAKATKYFHDHPELTKEKDYKKSKESSKPKSSATPKISQVQLLKILKQHNVHVKEGKDGRILAGNSWDENDNEVWTDVTNYSMKKLKDFLGY